MRYASLIAFACSSIALSLLRKEGGEISFLPASTPGLCLEQGSPTLATLSLVDFNSQNSPAKVAGVFWELKSSRLKVAKVGDPWSGRFLSDPLVANFPDRISLFCGPFYCAWRLPLEQVASGTKRAVQTSPVHNQGRKIGCFGNSLPPPHNSAENAGGNPGNCDTKILQGSISWIAPFHIHSSSSSEAFLKRASFQGRMAV
ncbi:uncharacterized protein LOC131188296 [Ahaetulla prasina]|uniref:uncharacterized protein LOC131188296 n=1 Tax=Ahaetulla prasina TaxID=499056 RepID=UPI0026471BDD|nr:uncharacterized protein LOC131188296 [Ahaetulla prasina]